MTTGKKTIRVYDWFAFIKLGMLVSVGVLLLLGDFTNAVVAGLLFFVFHVSFQCRCDHSFFALAPHGFWENRDVCKVCKKRPIQMNGYYCMDCWRKSGAIEYWHSLGKKKKRKGDKS